jgi:hypothetical protein
MSMDCNSLKFTRAKAAQLNRDCRNLCEAIALMQNLLREKQEELRLQKTVLEFAGFPWRSSRPSRLKNSPNLKSPI